MVIFFPSIHPSLLSSCRNASTRTALPEAVLVSRKPMRKIFPGCCASTGRAKRKEHEQQRARTDDFFLHVFCCSPHSTDSLHLITLSARASTFGGIVRPICLAAFRLMMNSNFVGCSTGRSAGLAPLRILSTYVAARRNKSSDAHAVAHKPAVFHKFWPGVYRREPALYREFCNLCSLRIDDGARQHEDCVSPPLTCGSECSLNILGTYVRLGIEASLATPLRRVPSLLTLARCPGWSKSRRRPRGRA